MPEIRRTIMNTFKDAQECQMFVMILKQKWSEFDIKLKDKLTVEIATDVADPCKHTAYVTAQSVEDFKLVEEWASKEVLPLRNKFAPKNNTFTCELDARFEFGGV
jgi:hypothetical protein